MKYHNRLLILFFIGFIYILLIQCKKEIRTEATPEILQLDESHAVVAWKSEAPYTGKVNYKPAGTQDASMIASDKLGENVNHEVEIVGLKPSTQYIYWIDGMEDKYYFQTKPVDNKPFSFLVTSDTEEIDYLSALQIDACSFVLSFNRIRSKALSACAPYAPIMLADSLISIIDWGGFRLLVAQKETDLNSSLIAQGSHTLGLLIQSDLIGNIKNLDNSIIHKTLLEHNAKTSATPVSFVGLLSSNMEMVRLDDICYFGLAQGNSQTEINNFTFTVNVDIESSMAYFVNINKEIILKEPPLQGKRTCQECRRLAEKGANEESIKAYKQFIETNIGHYQIDDAYFAIAELLDEKLFQYSQALEWYNGLLNDFPSSNLVPLASQRINYISNYSDNDYKPLSAFENIKNHEFAKANNSPVDQEKVLQKLIETITQYPDSKLAPVMQMWVANQYQLINMEKSVANYTELLDKYPEFSKVNEVRIKIGETYYNNEKWSKAFDVYSLAIDEFPAFTETINSQLLRIKRNIHRIQYNYISIILLSLIFLVLLFVRPFGLKHPGWKALLIGFIINIGIMFLYSWLYREEFTSFKEMILLNLVFTASIFMSVFAAYTFSRKILQKHKFIAKVLGNLLGIIVLMCGFYQGIYHIYVHYLTVFGL